MSIRWVSFRNDSGEEIPAFGVVRITGVVTVNKLPLMKAEKPNGDAPGEAAYFINGAVAVADGRRGKCCYPGNGPTWAAYDTEDGTPAAGEQWGPEDDSWELAKDAAGFRVIGGATDGRVLVVSDVEDGSAVFDINDDADPLSSIGTTTATRKKYINSAWEDTDDDSVAIDGDFFRGYAFPGERIRAEQHGSTWFAIGSGHTLIRGKLQSDLIVGGSSTLTVQERDLNGDWSDSTNTVTISDEVGLSDTIPADTIVIAGWHEQGDVFIPLVAPCDNPSPSV